MRYRDDAAAGFLLVTGEIVPQQLRIGAFEKGEGTGLRGLVGAVSENDHAVQVVALGGEGPFESRERGELPRVVVVIDGLDDVEPDIAVKVEAFRGVPALHGADIDDVGECRHAPLLAGVEQRVGLCAPFVGQKPGIRRTHRRRQPQHLGVLGDGEEVEGPDQLHRLPGIRQDPLAAGDAERVVHGEAGADQSGVEGDLGVKVQVAEQHLVGIVAVDEWGIGHLLGHRLRADNALEGVGSEAGGCCEQHRHASNRFSLVIRFHFDLLPVSVSARKNIG